MIVIVIILLNELKKKENKFIILNVFKKSREKKCNLMNKRTQINLRHIIIEKWGDVNDGIRYNCCFVRKWLLHNDERYL